MWKGILPHTGIAEFFSDSRGVPPGLSFRSQSFLWKRFVQTSLLSNPSVFVGGAVLC